MAYDHRERVGNEGDVVKHAVLCRVVAEILKESEEPFLYCETHAGRASYVLPNKGRWLEGIKKLSDVFVESSQITDELHQNLAFYQRLSFPSPLAPGSTYYGSSGMVFKMLYDAGRRFSFRLWDKDSCVCHSLLSFFEDWPDVEICRGDGYSGIKSVEKATLVLIDPVDVIGESSLIIEILSTLKAKNIPFICWTAMWETHEAPFLSFRKETERAGFVTTTVKWNEIPCARTWGCQITTHGSIANSALKTIIELARTLRWKVSS